MTDLEIIELYWNRNELAVSESNSKYGAYCFTVADTILLNREDSNECVNSTWFKAWNAIPPHRPEILKLFFAKITRNLAINKYRQAKTLSRGAGEFAASLDELRECVPDQNRIEYEIDKIALNESVNKFLKTLSERDCCVFLRRYFYSESVKEIAEYCNLTESNTLSILHRTRKKLKMYLEKEGYSL